MKKFIFFLFISMLFFACSKDEKTPDTPDESGLVFEIMLQTQLKLTKVGTPLYSQEPTHNIANVSIYAFENDGADNYLFVKQYEISDWTPGMSLKRHVVPEDEELPAGDYKFLAVGRSAADHYQILPTLTSTVNVEEMLATLATSGDEHELFSGVAQQAILAEGTRVVLELTRKVAGIMGYFVNVPQTFDSKVVKYLRLTASRAQKNVNLVSGVGSSLSGSYDIFNVDLSTQSVENEIYVGNDLTGIGVVKLPNSQLNGAYMIPVDAVTLTLGLYSETDTIKTWLVTDGGSTSINIQANHFYSLGLKNKTNTTTGFNSTDPGDDDNAVDLLEDQTIAITVNPAWTTIHDLMMQ